LRDGFTTSLADAAVVLSGDFEEGCYPFALWTWRADVREEFGMAGMLYSAFAVHAWWWRWIGLRLSEARG
jgi:hypothetical protein